MTKQIEVVFEDGVLKPLRPIDWLEEHRQVTVVVDVPSKKHPLEGWVGSVSKEDADAMRKAIDEEYERVDPDDWK